MRIAQIAPLYEAVPPRLYGSTERVVYHLTEALIELGHEVTLFASAEARTRAQLIPVRPRAIRLDTRPRKSDLAAQLVALHEVRRHAGAFDVLHFHTELLHLPLFEDLAARTVTTLHGRLDIAHLDQAYRRWPQFGLVSISERQRAPLPEAHWLGTVPHGVLPQHYRFSAQPRGYLAFLGRIAPEKRLDRAIAIARRAGLPLKIAAKLDSAYAVDLAHYRDVIEPLRGQAGVEFVGEIDDEAKSEFLGGAAALLFPVEWPEPFGLVLIEVMACGTPVIASGRGAVPEIVEHGVNGFIADSEEDAAAAVALLPRLDRAKVRRSFEQRFSATLMARRYVELYRALPAPRQRGNLPATVGLCS